MTDSFQGSSHEVDADASRPEVLHLRSPFLVEVLEERDEALRLRDSRGITADVHPSILRDNGLEIRDGRVVLPGGVYRHYFGKRTADIRRAREQEDLSALVQNFPAIWREARRIRETPELACAYSTACFNAGIPLGIRGYLSIGTLIDFWRSGDLVQPCPRCGAPAYAYHIIGSYMSGRTSARGVCPDCGVAVTFHPWRGKSVGRILGLLNERSQELFLGQDKGRPGILERLAAARRAADGETGDARLPAPKPPRLFVPTDLEVPETPFPRIREVVEQLGEGE